MLPYKEYLVEEARLIEEFGKIFDYFSEQADWENPVNLEERKINRYEPEAAQPWANTIDQVAEPGQQYAVMQEYAENTRKEFSRKLKGLSSKARAHNAKVLTDIKEKDSLINKITVRGKKASEITDVLRGAILTKTQEEADRVVDQLLKREVVVEYDDRRAKNRDDEYGYHGSQHLLIKMANGVIAEIQVMPKRLWAFKDEAHKIYDKYEKSSGIEHTKAAEIRDKKYSKNLFSKGNIPSRRRGKRPTQKFNKKSY